MKFSLKGRLMISYGLMSLFLVVSFLLMSNYLLEHHFQVYIQQKQERDNQNLVAAVLDEFNASGMPREAFLARLGNDAINNGIMLMLNDADGKQIYCAGCSNTGSCDNMSDMMKNTMRKRYPDWQGTYNEQVYPLKQNGEVVGNLVLGYYGPFFLSEEDQNFIKMLNLLFYLVAAFFLAIAFGLGAFLAERIARPIKYVIERTQAIEQRQYQERIDFISNTKELDQLIASVNTLSDTLEKQQEIKRRMGRDYAHEFRTPLAALQSNLEAMIDGIFEPTTERLESCRTEILRLSRMTGQINEIVEIENSNLFPSKELFDFSELVGQIAAAFERDLHEKSLALELSIERSVTLRADKDKISQVVVNLLSNAIKYTDKGGRVYIAVAESGSKVSLSVKDTGAGIAKEELASVFEYLYRTDSSRARDTGGFGIGLAVVKSIVTAHGGTISAESILGKGSKFTVILPKQ